MVAEILGVVENLMGLWRLMRRFLMRSEEMDEEKLRERWLGGRREVEAEVRWGLVAEERSLEKANEAVTAAIFLEGRWRRR